MGRWFSVNLIFAVLLLHLGAIRKDETALQKTQTDPIGYKEKMEEIKDGEKGPATPSLKFYPKDRFLVDPPVAEEKARKEEDLLGLEGLPEDVEEGFELDEEGQEKKASEDDWWLDWEEEETEAPEGRKSAFENSFKEEGEIDEFREGPEGDEKGAPEGLPLEE